MITDIIFKLMKGQNVENEDLIQIEEMLNNYTNLIKLDKNYKCVKIPSLLRGTIPFHKYNVINYALSVLPISKYESTFDYYLVDKKFKKKTEKLSINEWSMKLVASLHGINHECANQKFKIPFKYNLDDESDVDKIIEYITKPLLHSEEYSEILELEKKLKMKSMPKNKFLILIYMIFHGKEYFIKT